METRMSVRETVDVYSQPEGYLFVEQIIAHQRCVYPTQARQLLALLVRI